MNFPSRCQFSRLNIFEVGVSYKRRIPNSDARERRAGLVGRFAILINVGCALTPIVLIHAIKLEPPNWSSPAIPLWVSHGLIATQIMAGIAGLLSRRSLSGKVAFLVTFPLLLIPCAFSLPPATPGILARGWPEIPTSTNPGRGPLSPRSEVPINNSTLK